MLTLVLFIILVIASIVLFIKGQYQSYRDTIVSYRWTGVIPLLLAAGVLFYGATGTLANQDVGVRTTFSSIDLDNPIIQPGLYLKAPWTTVTEMQIRGDEIDVTTDANSSPSMAKDKVPLSIAVSLPFALNPRYAPHVLARVGNEAAFKARLQSSAQTALKEAAASMDTWGDIATDKREVFEKNLHDRVLAVTEAQLLGLGFTKAEAEEAFTFLPLQVKHVLPPKAVIDANALNAAAVADLARQSNLTQQAVQIALRREQEGVGIAKMMEQLPKGFTPAQISEIIRANATDEQAKAVMQLANSGKVGNLTVITGAAVPSVSADK